jgi:hypothetical protein
VLNGSRNRLLCYIETTSGHLIIDRYLYYSPLEQGYMVVSGNNFWAFQNYNEALQALGSFTVADNWVSYRAIFFAQYFRPPFSLLYRVFSLREEQKGSFIG